MSNLCSRYSLYRCFVSHSCSFLCWYKISTKNEITHEQQQQKPHHDEEKTIFFPTKVNENVDQVITREVKPYSMYRVCNLIDLQNDAAIDVGLFLLLLSSLMYAYVVFVWLKFSSIMKIRNAGRWNNLLGKCVSVSVCVVVQKSWELRVF